MVRPPVGAKRPVGRPRKTDEQKRLIGNPGRRPLPDEATITLLPAAVGTPEPARPLGTTGLAMWTRIWNAGATWLAPSADSELILMLCERMDERTALRFRVLRDNDWRERSQLRALEAQMDGILSAIAFTPTDRARLGVAEVKPASRIEALLLARRQAQ